MTSQAVLNHLEVLDSLFIVQYGSALKTEMKAFYHFTFSVPKIWLSEVFEISDKTAKIKSPL